MEKVTIQFFGRTAIVNKNLVATCARKEMLVAIVKSYIEKQKDNPADCEMYEKLIRNRTNEIINCNYRLNNKVQFV